MRPSWIRYLQLSFLLVPLLVASTSTRAQRAPGSPQYGPNDTLLVPMYVFQGDTIPARTLEMVWVNARMTSAMRKHMAEWTRLRNAVYVTFPYARKAGIIMNDINGRLAQMSSQRDRKSYLKEREKDLKREFTDPLEHLSVYQGKILMKLINRQTGNNCYDIIKEYKGSLTARFWQTVAFFFDTSLKQPYDATGEDYQIEGIVREVERMYHG
jgi:Domain of unknown function (DUF4294)